MPTPESLQSPQEGPDGLVSDVYAGVEYDIRHDPGFLAHIADDLQNADERYSRLTNILGTVYAETKGGDFRSKLAFLDGVRVAYALRQRMRDDIDFAEWLDIDLGVRNPESPPPLAETI